MAPHPPPAPAFSFTVSPSASPFNVSMEEYLDLHKDCEAVASGGLVFDDRGRLLIIQRAAHDSMPHRWEIPGGACDLTDETILHGVAREVWEETGLKVRAIGQRVGPGDCQIFFTRKGLKVWKYSFEVQVESTEGVRIDPNEHQNYLWVTEAECKIHKVEDKGSSIEISFTTPAQEATILEGFRLRKPSPKSL